MPKAPVCAAVHNPGVWPYTARCVGPPGHTEDHIDRHGNRWPNTGRHIVSTGPTRLRVTLWTGDDAVSAVCGYAPCVEAWQLNHGTLPRIIRHLMEHETEGS